MKVALILNIVGTVVVGVVPMIGRIAGAGGGITFRSSAWRSGWLVGWIVFLIGIALMAAVR
jgi:hypothetical protein